ncbi:MAG: hypothetical protein ABW069_16385 [Duganella sp.]
MTGDKKLCDATDFRPIVVGLASISTRQNVVRASDGTRRHSSRNFAVDAGRLAARRKRGISRAGLAKVLTSAAGKQNRSGDSRAVLSNPY